MFMFLCAVTKNLSYLISQTFLELINAYRLATGLEQLQFELFRIACSFLPGTKVDH